VLSVVSCKVVMLCMVCNVIYIQLLFTVYMVDKTNINTVSTKHKSYLQHMCYVSNGSSLCLSKTFVECVVEGHLIRTCIQKMLMCV